MQPTNQVFVYGLLMFPDIVQAITGKQYPMQDAMLHHYRRYGLRQSPLDAPVPALVAEEGAHQTGKLLLDVDDDAIAKLDLFEEVDSGHYIKSLVRVESGGQWYSAICYTVGPALQPYLSGEWQPELVTATQRQNMVESLIPDMLQALTTSQIAP